MNRTWFRFLFGLLLIHLVYCQERNLRLFDELDKYWLKIRKFAPQVERINDYLERHVADPNDRHNSMLALQSQAAESVKDPPLHQAIMTIIGLGSSLDPSCDQASFLSLAETYLLIEGEPREFNELNRVEQLVLGFGLEHKKLCLLRYVDKFEKRVRNLLNGLNRADHLAATDLDNLGRIFDQPFFDRLSFRQGTGNATAANEATILEIMLNKIGVYNPATMRELVKRLKDTWPEISNDSKMTSNEKARKLVQSFREPCQHYYETFADIFKPFKFDAMTFAGRPSLLCDDLTSQFCNHWKLFRTCEAYVAATKLIDKVEKIIDSQTNM